jgi:hypothetical protein
MSAASSKSVSFEEQRAPSVSSTKSIKAESVGPYGKKHYVSVGTKKKLVKFPKLTGSQSMCYPTGRWYDCLRPTTKPYQSFGGMVDFADSQPDQKFAGTKENWTRDIHHKQRSS